VHRNQGTSGADVDRSGKFQEVPSIVVLAAYENRDSKRQANPLATFWLRFVAIQPNLRFRVENRFIRTLGAKLMMAKGKPR